MMIDGIDNREKFSVQLVVRNVLMMMDKEFKLYFICRCLLCGLNKIYFIVLNYYLFSKSKINRLRFLYPTASFGVDTNVVVLS